MDRDDNKGMACSDELLTPRTRNAAFFLTNMGEENGDHPGPEKAFEPAGHSNPKPIIPSRAKKAAEAARLQELQGTTSLTPRSQEAADFISSLADMKGRKERRDGTDVHELSRIEEEAESKRDDHLPGVSEPSAEQSMRWWDESDALSKWSQFVTSDADRDADAGSSSFASGLNPMAHQGMGSQVSALGHHEVLQTSLQATCDLFPNRSSPSGRPGLLTNTNLMLQHAPPGARPSYISGHIGHGLRREGEQQMYTTALISKMASGFSADGLSPSSSRDLVSADSAAVKRRGKDAKKRKRRSRSELEASETEVHPCPYMGCSRRYVGSYGRFNLQVHIKTKHMPSSDQQQPRQLADARLTVPSSSYQHDHVPKKPRHMTADGGSQSLGSAYHLPSVLDPVDRKPRHMTADGGSQSLGSAYHLPSVLDPVDRKALHSLAQQSMGHALSVAAHPNELLTRGSPADIDSRAAMDPPDMDQTTHIPDGRHNAEPDDDSADDAD